MSVDLPLSHQAVLLMREKGLTCQQAAEAVGVSRQAVSETWHRLFPNEKPPVIGNRRDALLTGLIVQRAFSGFSAKAISEETECSLHQVRAIANEAGVLFSAAKTKAMENAVAMVASGSSLGVAAGNFGVSWGGLARACRARGITPSAKHSGNRTGKGLAGAVLVQQRKLSVSDAARAVGCSPNAIRKILLRIEKSNDTRTSSST